VDRAAGQLHLDVDAPSLDALERHRDHPPRHAPKSFSSAQRIPSQGQRPCKNKLGTPAGVQQVAEDREALIDHLAPAAVKLRRMAWQRPAPTDGDMRLTGEGDRLEAELTGAQMRHLAAAFDQASDADEAGWRAVMAALGKAS
jgi:hypothetical protein